ncbi:MAG: MoxR family ATPase [Acidobacteria bacterium Pan2503]|uniref:MoxR family ATPase n=1 Tax=Candidatus Acidiferrum panamense TaxID=2741543 RepID=A0A7V8SV42_9BACT|nr:MoxR family ATPase [Candidatus Acidoferrum panamensis]
MDAILSGFERLHYIADRSLATAIYLVAKLRKPILVEGHAGLGKTEVAKALAAFLGTRLIRLQCYEGLDVSSALYEWNYQKQLLAIKIQEQSNQTVEEKERHVFSREFLLERPLLQSILAEDASPVLLIDEIDRTDEAFEAFLLELLSDFQVSIPELGTISAKHVPFVVLTSNRSRELGDALKRRCLYQWIDYPSFEKEMRIVRARLPGMEEELAGHVVRYVQAVRQLRLSKQPGVAETLDCAQALMALGKRKLDAEGVEETLGCISKSVEDSERVRTASGDLLIASTTGRSSET